MNRMTGTTWTAPGACAALVAVATISLMLSTSGSAQSGEQQVIADAATALGGRERILGARTLLIEGVGFDINYGQGHSFTDVGVQSETFALSPWKRSYELGPRRARFEQARTAQHAFFQAQVPQKSVQGLDGNIAYNVAVNGSVARQFGDPALRARLIEYNRYPLTILRTALDPATKLSNARTQGSERLVDVTFNGATVTLAIDNGTKLPTRVFWTGTSFLGDTVFQTVFADYRDIAGLKLPTRLTYRSDRFVSADFRLTNVSVDGAIGDLTAPAAVASAAAPAPAGPPGLPVVEVAEIAKGVFHMTGQTHHSMIVEFSDHMVLIEPPNEARVLAVLAKARELRPNKPVTKVVLSHHHSDHSSGLRAAVSEGVNEVIVHSRNVAYAQELLKRPWTVAPDALAKKPNTKPVKFTGVADELILKDSLNELRLHYVLDNTHSDNMLSIFFPSAGIYTQGDIYMPDDRRNIVAGYPEGHAPWIQNVHHNILYRKLNVVQHVPLHGGAVSQAQFLESALRLQLMNPLKPGTN